MGCRDLFPHLHCLDIAFSTLSLSLSLCFPLLRASPPPLQSRRGGLWSADIAPDSEGVESPASLFGKWPWMETNRRTDTEQKLAKKPSPGPLCDAAHLKHTHTHMHTALVKFTEVHS